MIKNHSIRWDDRGTTGYTHQKVIVLDPNFLYGYNHSK